MALGLGLRAISKLLGPHGMCDELSTYSRIIKPENLEEEGKKLASSLQNKVPIIYASTRNKSVVQNWKIKFNETGKIPAFFNIFPELNHNEMTGFDVIPETKKLSSQFHFIFLRDERDDSRTKKRMDVCEKLYKDRGLEVASLPFRGETVLECILNSLLLADWTSYHLALFYGVDSENVPMVEEFKKLIEK
jgi:glucose/mannose-6-phosphate isomerase